jgi:hypothetical protein
VRKKYRAFLGGQAFERTTERTYTHCVVRERRDQPGVFMAVGWCGRLELAEKLARREMVRGAVNVLPAALVAGREEALKF